MKKIILASGLTMLFVLGCNREDMPALPEEAPSPPPAAEAIGDLEHLLPQYDHLDDDSVLARVGERKLLYGDAVAEAKARLAPYMSDIPPGELDMARSHMLQTVLEQFIKRSVLLDEASRLDITISEEEKAAAYRKIEESLPPGRTVEEIMKSSTMGEERMREEVRVGLIIDKLLAREMSNRVAVVSEDDIDLFVEQHREQLSMPEMARARHILIGASEDDDEAVREQRRQKAEDLQQALLDGADFAAKATQHSDCPSAQRGGDLGIFRRGQMVDEFDEAAFSQEIDEIGPLVETVHGYHIIQVYERHEAGHIPRKEIREMLEGRGLQDGIEGYIDDLMKDAEIFIEGH